MYAFRFLFDARLFCLCVVQFYAQIIIFFEPQSLWHGEKYGEKNRMKNILKSKRGLSTVVTTLIILVVSVLLATVVTYYAINITTNRMAQESLQMSNLHVWYNTTSPGWAEAAFALTNTGGKDVVLQSITTRSQPAAWTNVYYWTTDTATISTLFPTDQPLFTSYTATIPHDVYNATSHTWTNTTQTITVLGYYLAPINGTTRALPANQVTLKNATGVITLKAGWTIVVYVMHPGSIGQNDVGTPIDVTVFTANAQWTQETNVQAAQ
jgi:hypothetical protein